MPQLIGPHTRTWVFLYIPAITIACIYYSFNSLTPEEKINKFKRENAQLYELEQDNQQELKRYVETLKMKNAKVDDIVSKQLYGKKKDE